MSAEKPTHKRLKAALVALALVLAAMAVLSVQALADDAPNVARISTVVNDTFILGKDDVEWSYAEPNLIVEEGDLLQTNKTGRVEVQFDRNVLIRIGERTRIAAVKMDSGRVVGMDNGRLYLRIADRLSQNEAVMLTFASGQLFASENALVRVDILDDGKADVKVIRGRAQVEGTSGVWKTVQAGDRIFLSRDGRLEFANVSMARGDDFDAWNEQRDIALSTYRRPSYLSRNLVGEEDLNGYGTWVYSGNYNSYAWQPYVVQTWRPYSYGYWYHSSFNGWCWVPYEPWGYVTYHYGAWVFDPSYGWLWVPGYTWRPAYVSWVVYDDYIGWAPLNCYGYPVITTSPFFVTTPFVTHVDVFSFTFVRRDHFRDEHAVLHDEHALLRDEHGTLRKEHQTLREEHQTLREDYLKLRENRRGVQPTVISVANLGKVEQGKLRFVNSAENIGLDKSPRKGVATREKLDVRQVLDVNKHPELKERVAKIEATRMASEKMRADSLPAGPPKKREWDRANALDFRKPANRVAALGGQTMERNLALPKSESKTEVIRPNGETRDRRAVTDSSLKVGERSENLKNSGPASARSDRLLVQVTEGKTGPVKVFRSQPLPKGNEQARQKVETGNRDDMRSAMDHSGRSGQGKGDSVRVAAQPGLEQLIRNEMRGREAPKSDIPTPTVGRRLDRKNNPNADAMARPTIIEGREITPANGSNIVSRSGGERSKERFSRAEEKMNRELSQGDRLTATGRETIPPLPQQRPRLSGAPQMEARQFAMPAPTQQVGSSPVAERRLVQEPRGMQAERATVVETGSAARGNGREFAPGSSFGMRGDGRGYNELRGAASSGRDVRGR